MRRSLPLAAMLAAAALGVGASSAFAAEISVSDAPVVTEGSNGQAGVATFTVTTKQAFNEMNPVEFQYTTAPGTAGADDYVVTEQAVNEDPPATPCMDLAGCEETSQIRIPVTPDDLDEPDEVFFLHLTSRTMTVIDGDATATIADDDLPAAAPAPGVSAAPAATYGPAPASGSSYAAPAPAPSSATAPAARPVDADDATGPAVGITFRGLRGRYAKVRVKCPDDERRCVGRVSVGLYDKSLASKAFRLKGGASKLVKLRLSRRARHTLVDAGFVYLKASAFDAAGNRHMHAVTEQL